MVWGWLSLSGWLSCMVLAAPAPNKAQLSNRGLSADDLRILSGNTGKWASYSFQGKEAWERRKVSTDGSLSPRKLVYQWAKSGAFSVVIDADVTCRTKPIYSNVPMGLALQALLRSCDWGFVNMGLGSKPKVFRLMSMKTLKEKERIRLLSLIHQPIKIRLLPTLYRRPEQLVPILKALILSPKGDAMAVPGINILVVRDYVPFLIRAEGFVYSVDVSHQKLKKDILNNRRPLPMDTPKTKTK
ncbi:MAG: hypothetical protein EP343_03710 [Deltaproteobacteria bacterium]|nr:MAG: hypothetical protein EP343_03710 [Deltaproteobacteria bacterium]